MSKIILILLFIFFLVYSISKNKPANSLQSVIVCAAMILLITFRDSNMADYSGYTYLFEHQYEFVEPFHLFLIEILNSGGFTVVTYFFIIALLTVTLQFSAIRKIMGKFWGLSILTWLGTSFVLNDMVTIRAGLAASLLLWMVYYKVEKKLLYIVILLIASISIHLSSAAFIIIFFLSPSIVHRKYYLLGLVFSILCPIVGFSLTDFFNAIGFELFDEKMLLYLNGEHEANVFNPFQLIKFAIAVVIWLYYNRINPNNKYFLLSLKIYTIGCIWYFMTYKIMAVAWRISCLFWTVDVFVYPFLAYLISKKLTPGSKLIPAGISAMFFIVNVSWQLYWNPA